MECKGIQISLFYEAFGRVGAFLVLFGMCEKVGMGLRIKKIFISYKKETKDKKKQITSRHRNKYIHNQKHATINTQPQTEWGGKKVKVKRNQKVKVKNISLSDKQGQEEGQRQDQGQWHSINGKKRRKEKRLKALNRRINGGTRPPIAVYHQEAI